ncbi:MAG: OmpA family protein [Pseudomonadota bacterium]|nr:OmpA family protein [Pseudomonadota bacterium]
MKRLSVFAVSGLLAAGLVASSLAVLPARAQTLDAGSIVEKLTPKKKPLTRGLTRSFSASAPSAEEKADKTFLDQLPTRGLRIDQRKKLDEIVTKQELPSIDITIEFDFDSDRIRPESEPDVTELGKALTSEALSSYRIVLNGHTDAKGSADYNQDLSERRAASVRNFLIERFGIDGQRLIAVGFGEEKPKNAGDPESAENRRVEVINLTSS